MENTSPCRSVPRDTSTTQQALKYSWLVTARSPPWALPWVPWWVPSVLSLLTVSPTEPWSWICSLCLVICTPTAEVFLARCACQNWLAALRWWDPLLWSRFGTWNVYMTWSFKQSIPLISTGHCNLCCILLNSARKLSECEMKLLSFPCSCARIIDALGSYYAKICLLFSPMHLQYILGCVYMAYVNLRISAFAMGSDCSSRSHTLINVLLVYRGIIASSFFLLFIFWGDFLLTV